MRFMYLSHMQAAKALASLRKCAVSPEPLLLSLGECLLISSLPGKALRRLVDIARLVARFNISSQSPAW